MKVQPKGDRLLIRRDDAEKVSRGGILLPDKAQRKARLGTVLAAGPGRRIDTGGRLEMTIRVGAKVLFNVYGQHEVPGQDGLILVREEDVLAEIEEGA